MSAKAAKAAERKAAPPQEPHKTEQGEHASAVQLLPAANCAAQSKNAEGGDELGRTDEEHEQMADTPPLAEDVETA